jgi:hypothetical protein
MVSSLLLVKNLNITFKGKIYAAIMGVFEMKYFSDIQERKGAKKVELKKILNHIDINYQILIDIEFSFDLLFNLDAVYFFYHDFEFVVFWRF